MKTAILLILSLFSTAALHAQEKLKDTLFFNYDHNYIMTHVEIPNEFYIKDGSGSIYGTFFLKEVKVLNNLKPKKILCLKEFVQSSKYYDKNKKPQLDDYKMAFYINNYTLFLTKKNKSEYIQVVAAVAIE